MNKKVDARIETIFSHAVALDQAGRLRNLIFVRDKNVFILNQDHTVFLRFILPAGAQFSSDVSFKACDYDSPSFSDREGLIVFEQRAGDLVREKSCTTPGMSPKEAEELFAGFPPVSDNKVSLHKDVLSLLDERLSHIEFSGAGGELRIIQRNIYDGTVITIKREEGSGFGVSKTDSIQTDFGPIGLRTNDFMALFAFNDHLTFSFGEGDTDYCRVTGRNFKMSGVIALCKYDELGTITTVEKEKSNGRKKPQRDRGEQESDRPAKKGEPGKRRRSRVRK